MSTLWIPSLTPTSHWRSKMPVLSKMALHARDGRNTADCHELRRLPGLVELFIRLLQAAPLADDRPQRHGFETKCNPNPHHSTFPLQDVACSSGRRSSCKPLPGPFPTWATLLLSRIWKDRPGGGCLKKLSIVEHHTKFISCRHTCPRRPDHLCVQQFATKNVR